MFEFEIKSIVCSDKRSVWNGITTMKGVNLEFFPILKMTCPDNNLQLNSSHITDIPLFRSWLLLFGLIPIEYDLLKLTKIINEECFEEKSSMGLIKEWNHHRYISTVETNEKNIENTQNNENNTQNDDDNNNEKKDIKQQNKSSTLIIDRLSFIPRIPGTGYLLLFVVKALFYYRHWRLKMIYGKC